MRDISATDIDISHHIQRQILLKLRQRGSLTYAELKLDGLEGNAYNYHLRNLKQNQLIELKNGAYALTHTGHLVTDAFSYTTRRLMLRPYHYTTLLVIQNQEVLVYVPRREIQADRYSLPSGKLHYGDSIAVSIAREMKRRDLSADYTIHELCPLNVRCIVEGHIALHRPGILWHVDYRGPKATRQTESGVTQWMKKTEVIEHPLTLPELNHGLHRLQTQSHDPIDLEFTLQ